MPKCYICNYYDPKKVSLFRIPDRNDEYCERSALCLKLLDEKPENVHKIRICSDHFLQKKPAKSGDNLNLDWIPNKNLGRFSKNWKRVEFYFRKKGFKPPVPNVQQKAVDDNGQLQQNQNWNTKNVGLVSISNNNNLIVHAKSNSNGAANNPNNNNFNVVNVDTTSTFSKIISNNYNSNFDEVAKSTDCKIVNKNDHSLCNADNFDFMDICNNDNSINNDLNVTVNEIKEFHNSDSQNIDHIAAVAVANNAIKNFKAAVYPSDGDSSSSNNNRWGSVECNVNAEPSAHVGSVKSLPSTHRYLETSNFSVVPLASGFNQASRKALDTILIPLKKRKIQIIQDQFFFAKEMQTELSAMDIDMLFKYYKEAVEERDALLTKISTLVIDIDFFKGNDKKTRFYTGLPTWSLLNNFYQMIEEFIPTHFNCKLSRFQMVVLTLMKLRLNSTFTDLGYRFQIDETTASRYFHRCIYILFKLFENTKLVHWPERENLLLNTPSYFRSTFKESITIIVDCFELFIERSSLLRAVAQAFSVYKHHATLKYLIGISVTGAILFVSLGFGGRASDKEVVLKSGFLSKLQEGDIVLADKGFLIEQEVKAKDASLKIPSFVRNGEQLHSTEVEKSRDYARIRIHVERVICVLREKFNMCSDTAQMSAISKQNELFDNDLYDKIIFVCSCLVNICPSVVPNDFEM